MSTRTPTARKEGPRSKRGVILEASIERFGHDGFEFTKWASIADQVGIGQTALYHYFESKAHCLLTIMSLELERSLEQFKAATSAVEDDVARLEAAIESAYGLTEREALSARILLSHMDLLTTARVSEREEVERQRARTLVRAIEDEWTALVQQGMDSGAFAPRDARQTGQALLALIISVWRWYRPGGRQSLADISRFMSGACLRLVGPDPR
ncbi:TetR/AcrR family transcriptional regulator [Nocardioides zeae]|uniref:TetR/AcrR family transcriptional regulator n=1 Tax=Nocardioides imazamoxiresistens TaxID=3231893 RepID=A0ABU3PWL5_9ACTN|nr:TetR/AcrR family transcriptional regulator [Nocardioides zeae]MDT9593271.1 TetR/AcrR family transcriptional regulator [Nocardioides zeae]